MSGERRKWDHENREERRKKRDVERQRRGCLGNICLAF
jgi:hypothetical protein